MADYLLAELYKVTRRTYLKGFLLIMGLLEAVWVGMWSLLDGDMVHMSASVAFTSVLMLFTIGYYATGLTADMVFSEQYKHNTLKNEVSFGLSRARIYLGKLAVECLVSLASCFLILLWYAALCNLLLPGDGEWLKALQDVGFGLLLALPVWLGAQALFHMCLFLFKNSTVAAFFAMGVIALLGQVLLLLAMVASLSSEPLGRLILGLQDFLLTAPLEQIETRIGDWSAVGWAWAVGMGWFLAATALGYLSFRKREIS